MKPISFFVPCNPPKAGKKNNHGAVVINGKARVFKRKAAVDVENTWLSLLAGHAPSTPLNGAVRLSVTITLPLLASDTNTKAKAAQWEEFGKSIPHTSRPDASNMIEAIQDAMTALRYWNDDAQVCDLTIHKRRGNNPGIYVNLQEILE